MATKFIEQVDPTSDQTIAQILAALAAATGANVMPLVADGDTGLVHYYDRINATLRELVNKDQAQTLTNKTLSGVGAATAGIMQVQAGLLTELNGDGAYSLSFVLPAGAILHDILITGQALWTAGTSATLIVGDAVDDDGYATAGDAKSVPAVGATFSLFSEAAMGTIDGAYLNTDSIVGPTATNFGLYFPAGTTIKAKITKTGTGTAGRTHVAVIYAVPTVVAQVVV